MADDQNYHKRKSSFDDPVPSGAGSRRPTGFSSGPIRSPSPDKGGSVPPAGSYNSVPPPMDEIEAAKLKAQAIAARLFSAAESKRPRFDNGDDAPKPAVYGFSSGAVGHNSSSTVAPSQIGNSSYGYTSSSKRINIPNGRVGVIIGKSGETIKYLQLQSGAKIQVTRDMDSDPGAQTRPVEIMGTPDQISKAEQLINDVLAEADAASSNLSTRSSGGGPQGLSPDCFEMKVGNNKVGLIIGKGGETIKTMQAKTGAKIVVYPLHLPPGDTSTERSVYIDGTEEQIEAAKQLISEVTSENRSRNPMMAGGYRPPRPPMNWGQPGAQQVPQQPGYSYMQPGAYPGAPPVQQQQQQPAYGYGQPGAYPTPSPGGYQSGWEQSSHQAPQSASATGYDYYGQQQQAPVGSASSTDNSAYNYGQPPSYTSQGSYGNTSYPPQHGGQQYGYGGYAAGYQASGNQVYSQPMPASQTGYDYQQQGYPASYGAPANAAQDVPQPTYAANQVSGAQQSQAGGAPPPAQPPYGLNPANAQQNYAPPGQKLASPVYGQPPPPASTQGGAYTHSPSGQMGYSHGQTGAAPLPTYGQQQPYSHPSYSQQQPTGDTMGSSAYSAYAAEGTAATHAPNDSSTAPAAPGAAVATGAGAGAVNAPN